MTFAQKETEDYYNSFSDVYELIWNEQIHTGYFDTDKSLKEAVEDMTRHLAGLLPLRSNMQILDVGSGRGSVDRFLVKEFGVSVIGIDTSEAQLKTAEARALESSLFQKITYRYASMTRLPFDDGSFDILWVQEAFFHCHEKETAVKEFYRVLKAGGHLLIEDTILKNAEAEQEVMESFGKRVKINELWTEQHFVESLEQTGFKVKMREDHSQNLIETYGKIIETIRAKKASLRDSVPLQYKEALEKDFNFPKTLELTRDRKIGCLVLIAQK